MGSSAGPSLSVPWWMVEGLTQWHFTAPRGHNDALEQGITSHREIAPCTRALCLPERGFFSWCLLWGFVLIHLPGNMTPESGKKEGKLGKSLWFFRPPWFWKWLDSVMSRKSLSCLGWMGQRFSCGGWDGHCWCQKWLCSVSLANPSH